MQTLGRMTAGLKSDIPGLYPSSELQVLMRLPPRGQWLEVTVQSWFLVLLGLTVLSMKRTWGIPDSTLVVPLKYKEQLCMRTFYSSLVSLTYVMFIYKVKYSKYTRGHWGLLPPLLPLRWGL